MNKVKNILTGAKAKTLAISGVVSTTLLTGVSAFAAEDATATISSAVTSGISDTKTTFLGILAVVVAGAMGFFAIKYAVNQGITFFSKISKKG